MSEQKFDCIIVGAGLSGITAAIVLAQNNLNVAVLERGDYPGSKNARGGVLLSPILNQFTLNIWESAPYERFIKKKKFVALGQEDSVSVEIESKKFSTPPYNNSFIFLKAKFDKWYTNLAESKGAKIFTKTLAEDLIYKNGRIIGVESADSKFIAEVVISADGVNSILARKANLRKNFEPNNFMLEVKEIIELPSGSIQSRFGLIDNEGIEIIFLGQAADGVIGYGFLYTNKDSLSVGITANIASLVKEKIKIRHLMEEFKSHPYLKNSLKDGVIKERSACLVPEINFNDLPEIYTDGLLLTGEAAGLVNYSLFRENSNLAIASGKFAAETVIEAKAKQDFSKKKLSLYEDKLKNSFVFKDMKKYRNINKFINKHPQFFSLYPQLIAELTTDFFIINEKSKEENTKSLLKKFKKNTSMARFLLDLNALRKNLM